MNSQAGLALPTSGASPRSFRAAFVGFLASTTATFTLAMLLSAV